jgi:hypothetical protein
MCYLAQLTLHGCGVFGFHAIEDRLNELTRIIAAQCAIGEQSASNQ